jgi:hypothetical protein
MRPACSAFSGLLKVAGKLRGKSGNGLQSSVQKEYAAEK